MKTILPALFCCFFLSSLHAQDEALCRQLREEGDQLARKKEYADAINRYWTAMIACPDNTQTRELSNLIQQTQKTWVRDLEDAVKREQAAYKTALQAREEAVTARVAEEKARKDAEQNAQKAREQGIRAESMRTALLADIIRQKGRKSDAVLLSMLSMKMSGTGISSFVSKTFGDVVRDSFSLSCFNSPDRIESLRYFPDGKRLLVQTAAPALYLLDAGAATPEGATLLPKDITQVVFAPDGTRLAGLGSDGSARLLDQQGNNLFQLNGHREAVRFITFSPDGRQILTCSRDNTARTWDTSGMPEYVLEGHTGNVIYGAFSPDNRYILTKSTDGTIRLWDNAGKHLYTFSDEDSPVSRAIFSPDSRTVVSITQAGKVSLYDVMGRQSQALSQETRAAQALIGEPDNAFFALRFSDNSIAWFDFKGQLQTSIAAGNGLRGAALHPSLPLLATWGKDKNIRLWNSSGGEVATLRGHRDDLTLVRFSAQREAVLSASRDGTAKLWDLEGNILMEWILGADNAAPACFSPDNSGAAIVGNGGKSIQWSPFPTDVYQRMNQSNFLTSDKLKLLMQEFNIQTFE